MIDFLHNSDFFPHFDERKILGEERFLTKDQERQYLLQIFLTELFHSEAPLLAQKRTTATGLVLFCFVVLLSSVMSLVQTSKYILS